MRKFRLLRADEIECRVAQCKNNGCSVLLYKTARTDADLLDETVGAEHWQNDFKLVDGVLYGGIGIDDVWKWDAGTESNTEAEKGRASDAFKRAGFKWGIGRELYSAPFIWITSGKCSIKINEKTGKPQCFDDFEVAEIDYDSADRISRLVIVLNGNTVFEWGDGQSTRPDILPICECCGNPIRSAKKRNGEVWSADNIARYTKARYDKALCKSCAQKAEAEIDNQ